MGSASGFRFLTAFVLSFALGTGAAAPTALANDESLRAAGKSRDAQFERLGKQSRKLFSAWRRSGFSASRALPVLRNLKRTRNELDRVEGALRAEEPSSEGGATYKRLILRSISSFDGSLRAQLTGVRARTAKKKRVAARAFRRADRLGEAAFRDEKAAIAAYNSR
ncbi:MAG: hypothetical protein H0U32_01900 [Thermoleophilaceae bacterium]|nr:hypothetical protein [Thermoleophilaceae bacterium]